MKEFDGFEKSMKNSLEGFNKIKPSRKLWLKISGSLLLINFLDNIFLRTLFIVTISTFGIAWYLDSNNYIFYSDSINDKAVLNVSIDSDEIEKSISRINDTFISKSNSTNLIISKGINETDINSEFIDIINESNLDEFIVNTNKDETKNNIVSNEKLNIIYNNKGNNSKIVNVENSRVIKENIILVNNSNNIVENNSISKSKPSAPKNRQTSNSVVEDIFINDNISKVPLLINTIGNYNSSINMEPILLRPLKKRIGINYDLFAGGVLAYSSIMLNPNNLSDKELSKKSINLNYNYGANINIYKNNWFMRLGLNLSTYSEEFNYSTTSVKIDTSIISYYLVNRSFMQTIITWNINGLDSIPIYGQTIIETLEKKTEANYDSILTINNYLYKNDYSIINIPFTVGYEFDFESIIVDVAVGVSWSRVIANNLHVLDPESGKVLNIDNKLINKNIFNGTLTVDLGYKYNSSLLFIRTDLYGNFNTLLHKEYFDKHKMYQMRLSAGIRFTIP